MQAPPTLLYFDDEQGAALGLAQAAGLVPAPVQRHRFPDGEIRLRLPDALPERVVLLRTLDHPNEKLVDLLLAARTARLLGARHLTLVAPYLAYMRQDIAFVPGEAISQRIVGRFLAELFDAVVTVDPHLHRVATLQEAVPVGQAVVLSGAPLLADLIAQRRPGALLVGPDSESAQWVSQAAARHGCDHAVCTKQRQGDHAVEIELPALPVAGRAVVLMDDVASTGHTVAQAARRLRAAGARIGGRRGDPCAAVRRRLRATAGCRRGCVLEHRLRRAHPSNVVKMAVPLAQALATLLPSGTVKA
jgi:ribose-phosphate pyrophosphokinase